MLDEKTISANLADGSESGVADDESWRGVVKDAFARNPHGIVTVSLALLGAPFATIFRLATDRGYRTYWSHLVVLTGLTAVALFVTLPKVFNLAVGQDLVGVADASQRLRLKMQVVQIASFLLLTPLQYYACRLISPVRREPRTYFKLCALSICFGLLVRIALGVVAFLAGLVIFYGHLNVGVDTVIQVEFMVGTLFIVAFVIELHRRFWSMALWKAVLLTIAFWLFTAQFLSPILFNAVQAFDHIDQIGKPKR